MTLTRASCGFWALFGPANYCTVCLICQILSNNDESKLFRSYIWHLATLGIAFEPVYKDKVRVGEKLFIPGPAYFWSVECELKSDKRF